MIKNYFNQLTLPRKILVYYVPLSILPLILVSLLMSNTFESIITDRTVSSASDNAILIINQIETMLDSAENLGNQLTININTLYHQIEVDGTAAKNLSFYTALSNELNYSLLTYSNIDSIAYYDLAGNLYTSNYKILDENQFFFNSTLFEQLSKTTGPNYWFPMMQRNYLVLDSTRPVFTMGKKIINIDDGTTLGFLLINIPEEIIENLLASQQYQYWLIDGKDKILSTNSDDLILMTINHSIFDNDLLSLDKYIGVRKMNKEQFVTTMLPFPTNSWRLIGQVPYKDLTDDLQRITSYLFIILVIIIIIDIIFSWFISNIITRPITELNQGMLKVSNGNFDIRLQAHSSDEIGTMADSFNHMSEKIKALLKQVALTEEQKREYELALIQEQIKPHFLYNCLDVIYTLSLMNRSNDAAKATKALADYYRLSLAKGQDIITLDEEMKMLDNYLQLQKIRYSDVLDYTIHYPLEYGKYKIMKLTLQPLVENAIYHGLKTKNELGHLTINIQKSELNLLTIDIIDNGIGMTEETIHELLEDKPIHNGNLKHYGLNNVKHRIQLFFGDTFGLTIKSQLDVGTTVTVTIPATTNHPKERGSYGTDTHS